MSSVFTNDPDIDVDVSVAEDQDAGFRDGYTRSQPASRSRVYRAAYARGRKRRDMDDLESTSWYQSQ